MDPSELKAALLLLGFSFKMAKTHWRMSKGEVNVTCYTRSRNMYLDYPGHVYISCTLDNILYLLKKNEESS